MGIDWAALAVYMAYMAISWAIGEALKKKPKIKSAPIDQYKIPDIEENSVIPVIAGWCRVPLKISWWGDVAMAGIQKHTTQNKFFNNKRVYYIAGYRYSAGFLFKASSGYCNVKQIYYGGKLVWPNSYYPHQVADDAEDTATINEWNILGGDEGQGGIDGEIDIMHGEYDQAINSYLEGLLGTNISHNRGFTTLVAKQIMTGTSAQPANLEVLVQRSEVLWDGSEQWYVAKADINGAINPAHLIREALTSVYWGKGESTGTINDESFTYAADTFYSDGIGYSRAYDSSFEDIDDYIADILRHCGAVLRENMDSGQSELVPLRNDYNVEELETFTEDEIRIEDFNRPMPGNLPTDYTVNFWDKWNNIKQSFTDYDPSLYNKQGKRISTQADFYGIDDPNVAAMVASTNHRIIASQLASMTIYGNRKLSHINKGDVFIVNYKKIQNMVVRVLAVSPGTLDDAEMKFIVTEDVYHLKQGLYVLPDTEWLAPEIEPLVPPDTMLMEIPYCLLRIFANSDEYFDAIANTTNGYSLLLAAFADNSPDFELLYRPDSGDSFEEYGTNCYTPSFQLNEVIPANAEEITVDVKNWSGPIKSYLLLPGNPYGSTYTFIINNCQNRPVIINNEIFILLSVSAGLGTVTLRRGAYDTVPQAHGVNDYMYFPTISNTFLEETAIPDGDTPGVKLLPNTIHGTLEEADAITVNADAFDSRLIRPYPPDDILVNGTSFATSFTGQPTVSWYHRSRTNITEIQYAGYHAVSTPESGTTYTLKIYDENDILVHTESGMSGTSYELTEANERTFCSLGPSDPLNTQLRFVLYSVRDGYNSLQQYDITVARV